MAQDVSRSEWCFLKSAVSVVGQAMLAATIFSNAAGSNARGQDLVPAPPDFSPSKPQVGETVIPDLVGGSPPGFMDDPPTTRSTSFMDVDGGELIFDLPAFATSDRIRELQDGTRRAFAHLERAREHLRGQANALALAECESALACNPDLLDTRRVRAQVFRALNRYDDALGDLAYVIAREPDDVTVLIQRASCLLERVLTGNNGSVADAKNAVSEVLELTPAEPAARAFRGVIAGIEGDAKSAIDNLSFAIEHGARWNDNSSRARACRRCAAEVMTLLSRQDLDRALSSFDRAIALEPNFALPYLLRAYVRGKKTAWLPATADVLLAIRRLALIKFKYGFETKRIDDEEEHLAFFIGWEYKGEESAPPAEREAMKLDQEVIEFAMSILLAAVFGPVD